MVGHFDYKHRCLVEKNVPIAFILPSRWQYGAESLGIERTSCLWPYYASFTAKLASECLPSFNIGSLWLKLSLEAVHNKIIFPPRYTNMEGKYRLILFI